MQTQYEFPEDPPAPPGRKLRCAEVALLSILVPALAALFIPALCPARPPRVTSCASRLSQLYKLGTTYAATHCGQWPDARGEELWTFFARCQPPVIEESQIELLFCPVKGEEWVDGSTDYRGPAVAVSRVRAGDPLGADKPDNHGSKYGGNVLRMDGGVMEHGPDEPDWQRCASYLKP